MEGCLGCPKPYKRGLFPFVSPLESFSLEFELSFFGFKSVYHGVEFRDC